MKILKHRIPGAREHLHTDLLGGCAYRYIPVRIYIYVYIYIYVCAHGHTEFRGFVLVVHTLNCFPFVYSSVSV